MKEKENQRYGRNKETTVNKSYLESGEYRNKFDSISNAPKLNKLLYQLAKKMLLHRSGTLFEDMYWIDPGTLRIVAEEHEDEQEETIIYSGRTKAAIMRYKGLITIHTHPLSYPPSASDLNANYVYGYSRGVVLGHDGKVFIYSCEEYISEQYLELKVADNKKYGYNEYEAQLKALEECSESMDFYVKEVISNGSRPHL